MFGPGLSMTQEQVDAYMKEVQLKDEMKHSWVRDMNLRMTVQPYQPRLRL